MYKETIIYWDDYETMSSGSSDGVYFGSVSPNVVYYYSIYTYSGIKKEILCAIHSNPIVYIKSDVDDH